MAKKRSKQKKSIEKKIAKNNTIVDGVAKNNTVREDGDVKKKMVAERRLDVMRLFGVPATIRFIFANIRLFLPLMMVAFGICVFALFVSEDAMVLVIVLAVLILWLVTLFFARRIMSGEKVRFRDGLYNAMTPLISSLVVFVILMIQCTPIMLVVIGYSAALETNLFGDMFYGSLFVIFAIIMVVVSGYLLSGTMMAMVAVSAPGMYPIEALRLSYELMRGSRVRFVLRALVLLVTLLVLFVVIVGPAVLVGLLFYNYGGVEMPMLVPIVSTVAGCLSVVVSAVYLYIYYRWMLGMNVPIKK